MLKATVLLVVEAGLVDLVDVALLEVHKLMKAVTLEQILNKDPSLSNNKELVVVEVKELVAAEVINNINNTNNNKVLI